MRRRLRMPALPPPRGLSPLVDFHHPLDPSHPGDLSLPAGLWPLDLRLLSDLPPLDLPLSVDLLYPVCQLLLVGPTPEAGLLRRPELPSPRPHLLRARHWRRNRLPPRLQPSLRSEDRHHPIHPRRTPPEN